MRSLTVLALQCVVNAAAPAGPSPPSMELVRWVTPYATDVNWLVRLTHFLPAILSGKDVRFYSWIDTWIDGTDRYVLSQDYDNGQCKPHPLDKDGREIDAELWFWRKPKSSKPSVREVIPIIAPSPLGRPLLLGPVEAVPGKLSAGLVTLASKPEKPGELERLPVGVYLGTNEAALKRILSGEQPREPPAFSQGSERPVVEVDHTNRIVKVKLEPKDVETWRPGRAVTLRGDEAPKAEGEDGDVAPFAGRVLSVDGCTAVVRLLTGRCFPKQGDANATDHTYHGWALRVLIPRAPSAPAEPTRPAEEVAVVTAGSKMQRKSPTEFALDAHDFAEPIADGTDVLVLTAHSNRIVDEVVNVNGALQGDEDMYILAHISGHGWERTSLKCGEFCVVTYTALAGACSSGDCPLVPLGSWTPTARCRDNPDGAAQSGTWEGERNAWCPGAVSEGQWVKISDVMRHNPGVSRVRIAIEFSVEGAERGADKYVNWDGYAVNDKAMLQVGLSLHRLASEAGDPNLHVGPDSSARARSDDALKRPTMRTDEQRPTMRADEQRPRPVVHGAASWFQLTKEDSKPDVKVPVFAGAIHHIAARTLARDVSFRDLDPTADYEVALHVRSGKPPPPWHVDAWDRVASIGLVLCGDSCDAAHKEDVPKLVKSTALLARGIEDRESGSIPLASFSELSLLEQSATVSYPSDQGSFLKPIVREADWPAPEQVDLAAVEDVD